MFGVGLPIPSNPVIGILVGAILLWLSRPIAKHVAAKEGDPRLVKVVFYTAALHLLAAPTQIFVVDHVYHGVADYLKYDHQGSLLADNFRHGSFTLKGSGVTKVLGDGAVSIAAGVIFTLVGTNQVAGFLVFAWLSFVGIVCFYRAFAITFPDGDRRRYALMVFFLPSLVYWTADVSKEAVMTFSLGVAALGCARVLVRHKRGYILILIGGLLGIWVRPNEVALLIGGFAIALFFRGRDTRKTLRGLRRLSTLLFMAVVLGFTAYLTMKFLHNGNSTVSLSQINKNNSGQGAGFGSSNVSYSGDPLLYPKDLYTVLFDPLPITAHSGTQLIAAGENSIILVLILTSLRRLRIVFRVARQRPYVLLSLLYSIGFVYAFAALGNLGLITRERTLLLPFMLVLLAVPMAPKGEPPQYPWEHKRLKRRERKQAAARAARAARYPARA